METARRDACVACPRAEGPTPLREPRVFKRPPALNEVIVNAINRINMTALKVWPLAGYRYDCVHDGAMGAGTII